MACRGQVSVKVFRWHTSSTFTLDLSSHMHYHRVTPLLVKIKLPPSQLSLVLNDQLCARSAIKHIPSKSIHLRIANFHTDTSKIDHQAIEYESRMEINVMKLSHEFRIWTWLYQSQHILCLMTSRKFPHVIIFE